MNSQCKGHLIRQPSAAALFYADGTMICMSRNFSKKPMDISGVELTPGESAVCLGNGEQGFECCCDECDCFLLCFPEFYPKSKKEKVAMDKG